MGTCCSKEKVSPKNGFTVAEMKDKIQSLDLIVFRGSDFVSDAISMLQKIILHENGDWTHVGLVITPEIMPIKNSEPGKIYVWESTMSGALGDGVNNVETNKGTFGVQIRDFEDVVDKYDNNSKTRIGWCKLINNPLIKKQDETDDEYNERKNKIINILAKFNSETGNATYDYNCCNLCSAVCPSLTNNRKKIFGNSNKYFCSELVTTLYQLIDIIGKDVDPENIAPEELLGENNADLKTKNKIVEDPVFITRIWQ
jgi:hypothetical protein